MTTIKLKKDIHKLLADTKDKELLEAIRSVLSLNEEAREIVKLSDAQKKAIKKAQNEIKNGKYSTASQVEKRLSKWLNA